MLDAFKAVLPWNIVNTAIEYIAPSASAVVNNTATSVADQITESAANVISSSAPEKIVEEICPANAVSPETLLEKLEDVCTEADQLLQAVGGDYTKLGVGVAATGLFAICGYLGKKHFTKKPAVTTEIKPVAAEIKKSESDMKVPVVEPVASVPAATPFAAYLLAHSQVEKVLSANAKQDLQGLDAKVVQELQGLPENLQLSFCASVFNNDTHRQGYLQLPVETQIRVVKGWEERVKQVQQNTASSSTSPETKKEEVKEPSVSFKPVTPSSLTTVLKDKLQKAKDEAAVAKKAEQEKVPAGKPAAKIKK